MEWEDKLQEIIDYVEEHLQRKEEPIDINEISRIAECSYPFFQKVFSYMNGISFADYIRYRKLTLAGYDLKSTDMKIVDLSYKYGYDSPTSFTKAFQKFHGITPKEAKNNNYTLEVFPKMQLNLKQKYSWKIEEKETFRLIGKCIKICTDNNQHYQKIPEFWDQCQKDGTFVKLISLDTALTKGMYAFMQDNDYYIMVNSTLELPDDYIEVVVSNETWAIFDCYGINPQAIQNGWKYLNQEWLVKYPFKHSSSPEIEWYSHQNTYDSNYLSQIWIPIIKEN
ncbi:MAG: effector binding domain-containing protein [Coprobacillus sp.]